MGGGKNVNFIRNFAFRIYIVNDNGLAPGSQGYIATYITMHNVISLIY